MQLHVMVEVSTHRLLYHATRECPPTRDTRLTGGSRVAREAASACKRRRIESSVSIALRITHLPSIRLLSASRNGESVHPPVTPV